MVEVEVVGDAPYLYGRKTVHDLRNDDTTNDRQRSNTLKVNAYRAIHDV